MRTAFNARHTVVAAAVALLAVALSPLRAANACTGTVPHCEACYAPTCSADIPQWHCDVAAAGTACNDSNLCTSSDVCDGNGTCGGTQMSCPISNGSGSCVPASGTCGYTCNNGYQLSGSTCVASPANATITLSSTKTTIATTGLTASVPVQPGATYTWSITGGTITAGQGSSTATFTATATPSTTLTVTVTTAANQTASSSATASVYAAAVATITAPSQVTAGATAIGASVPAQTGATYSWSLTGGTISSGGTTNSILFTAGSADPITLSVTVTNGAGSAQTSSDTIHVYPLPVASITAPSSVTANTANLSASVPAQTGDTFSWTVTGGTLTSGQGTNTIGFTAGAGASMTISCNVTNQAQTTTSGTKSIAIYPPPNATVSTSVSRATAGVTFTASVPSQSGTFVWTISGTGAGGTITQGSGTNAVTISPSLSGASPSTMTIVATVTNAAGATATSATLSIPVYAAGNATVTAPAIVTAGGTGYAASVPAQTGAAYAWTATGGSITAGAASNSITFTAGASGSVNLSVIVTTGAGDQAIGSSTSTITPVPNCAISSPTHVTAGKVGLTASAPTAQLTYSWTASGGSITAGGTTNAVTYTVGSGSTMTLTCSATNALGANDTETLTLAVVPPPVATIAAPSSAVAGTAFNASVAAQAGSTYGWSLSNAQGVSAVVNSGSGTNAVNITAANTAGATDSLTVTTTVTNAAGDSATGTAAVSVSPAPAPVITAPSFVTVSSTGNSAQTAAVASTYSWSITGGTITSDANTSSITFSPAGSSGTSVQLSLQITTSAGLPSPALASVQVVPLPQTPVVGGPTEVTIGVGGWTASVPSNANMQYRWTVTGGAITSANAASGIAGSTTNSITYTPTGAADTAMTITCVEINQAGAQSTPGTLQVAIYPAPVTPTISAQAPVSSGIGGFVASVNANDGMFYTWTISGGIITSSGGPDGDTVAGRNQIVFTVTAAAGEVVTISAIESNKAGTTSSADTVTLSIVAPAAAPGDPGAITGPTSAGPSFTLSWSAASGTVDHYDLEETVNGATPLLLTIPGRLNDAFMTGKATGSYSYRVRACNAAGCSAYTTSFGLAVSSGLPNVLDVPDASSGAPPQELAGAVPGSASVTGGSASYRVPIEVPPGRVGMQPELAFVYSSRSGNGVMGTGWSISGAGSITRCPATVAQDGAGRAMLRDGNDKLCFNGQRLMLTAGGAAYGKVNSVYYTETDPYDRITLKAQDMDASTAYFEVRHKNGRISQYTQSDGDTWYLARVYDPQGNCMQLNYNIYATPHGLPSVGVIGAETELTSIEYTGTGSPALQQCSGASRTVAFRYEPQPRDDSRATFQYGHAKLMTVRLAGIDTSVGNTPVRSYQLSYHASSVTGRSLLEKLTLCAGGPDCSGGKLPPITFEYQERALTAPSLPFNDVPFASPFAETNNWQIVPLGDLDGDGTRDLLYRSGANRLLALSSCSGLLDVSNAAVSLTPTTLITPATTTASYIRGATDIDHDGRADILALQGNVFATSTMDCAGNLHSTTTQLTLPANITTANGWAAGVADYDGDGRLDVLYTDGLTGDSRIVLDRTPGDAVLSAAGLFAVRDPNDYPMPPPLNDLVATTAQDFNGDGMIDQWYDLSSPGLNSPLSMAFFAPNPAPTSSDPLPYHWVVATTQSLGGVSPGDTRVFDGGFVRYRARRWIDVNGDGLPDFWDPGTQQLWINRGGPIGSQLFLLVNYVWDEGAPPQRLDAAMTMDIDGDGMEELLVPTTRVDAAHGGNFCLIDNDPGVVIDTDGDHPAFCGDDFDTAPVWQGHDYSKDDRSVFNWVAYRFSLRQTDGVYVLKAVPTGLTAPVRASTVLSIADVDGNGAPDVAYELFNSVVAQRQEIYQGADPANLGAHVAFNGTSAADLLTKVTQNIVPVAADGTAVKAVTSSWSYRTLSQKGAVAECGNSGKAFYAAHPGTQSLSGYAFFASSMPAVAYFDVSNGLDGTDAVGGATNRTCYRYEDGMMNEQGRGFQGFKIIYEEQRFAPAVGEAGSPGVTCDASGTACSANNLLKETHFLQVFPVTSRVERAFTRSQDGTLLSDSAFTWDVQPGPASGTWVVNEVGNSETTFDTTGARLSQTVTVAQFDLASGETTKRCVVSTGPIRLPTDVIACDTRAVTDEVTPAGDEAERFWIGRVDSQTVTTDFFPMTSVLPSIAYATSGSYPWLSGLAPVMPSLPAPSATQKTHATVNTWNEGGTSVAAGSRRKLATQKVAADANPARAYEKLTAYAYDAYGNVNTETVQGHNVSTDATYPPTTNTPPTFVTSHDFGASSGYFEGTETNPLSHVTTMTVDPGIGQPLTHQQLQSMPVTAMAYDGFGRLLSSTTPGTQQIDTRVLSCGVPRCVLRKEAWQAGAPAKVEYLDRLGRVIAEGIQGFDGNEVVTEIDYNARGAKVAEYTPASTEKGPGEWPGTPLLDAYSTTYADIDATGRVRTKTVARNPALFLGATGTANVITSYQYSVVNGLNTTKIQVTTPTTASGAISMSRSYDARGELVQTTQDTTSSPRGTITTSYSWNPDGTVTDIIDTAGNKVHADYDQYGRKVLVSDPDRGVWIYTWDGLGRVLTQTDARGAKQAYQYDAIGRMQRRFMLPTGATTWLLEGNWVYDTPTVGALGNMSGVVDSELGSLTDTTQDSFQKQFTYDDHLRLLTVKTHIPGGAGYAAHDLAMAYAYDQNHDRMKAMLFPGGEMVAYSYNALGMPTVETQLLPGGSLGTVYRTVNTMSPRGQITSQTFGNGVVETSDYDASTGMALGIAASGLTEHPTGCTGVAAPVVRSLSYAYDQFLNLAQQQKTLYQRDSNHAILSSGTCGAPLSETVSETYQYDELQRLRTASRSWSSGVTISTQTRTSDGYTYDDLGNITSKSDYADTYLYEGPPHQVSRVLLDGRTKASFAYDPNGNMLSGDGRTIEYDNFDRPVTVTMNGNIVKFRYAPDGSRYQQLTLNTSGALVGNEFYFDKMYEQVEDGGSIEGRSHVSDAVEIVQKASRGVRYRHLDRLGSLEAATTEGGAEDTAYEHGYDAFGGPRSRDWQWSGDEMGQTDERGFTGHEHLDNLRLIHMNGRVYDYKLGRFLSVDPVISKPGDSQSINPYSYIGNKPLSGTDPTGYFSTGAGCGKFSECDVTLVNPSESSLRTYLGARDVTIVDANGREHTTLYLPGSNKGIDEALDRAGDSGQITINCGCSATVAAKTPSAGGHSDDEQGERLASAGTIKGLTRRGRGLQPGDKAARRLTDGVAAEPVGRAMIDYLNGSRNQFIFFGAAHLPDSPLSNENAVGVTGNIEDSQGNPVPWDSGHVRTLADGTQSIDIRVDSGKIARIKTAEGPTDEDHPGMIGPVGTAAHEFVHAMLKERALSGRKIPVPFIDEIKASPNVPGALDRGQHQILDLWIRSHWGDK